ncbi:NCS2 family permease [Parabacteroides sp. OttesenSCG-928-G06]|nr:NCS2 family permease [Parabacteroides sp. OttesenSCG-928-G06]
MKNIIEKIFCLTENKTTIRREFMAGLTTFLTMSYILIVNPSILSTTGMDKEALFTATVLSTVLATLVMALYAKLPIALAPSMGLNAFFAFTICGVMGYSWRFGLTAVLLEGILFIIISFFKIREIIVKSIPKVLKDAIPVGIGLFITLIGLKNAGIVVANPATLVSLGDFSQHSIWIAILGLIVTGVLLARNVNGAILIGIAVATLFGVVLGDVRLPETSILSAPPSIAPVFAQFEWEHAFSLDMMVVVFTLLFVNLFDTAGTLIGVTSKAGLTDENGDFPQMKKALLSDAIGSTIGGILGTSTVTSYVESASGVAAGGRTGLTSVSTAFFFLLALFLAPLFLMVPAAATSPALIIVGLFMISSVAKINFNEISEGLPAFLTIVFMPFTYSIAEGIVYGILSFALIKMCSGKGKEVSVTVYVLAILFLLRIVLSALHLIG